MVSPIFLYHQSILLNDEMKTLGIFTKDFSLYHDLIKTLRRRKIPYVSLVSKNNIPRRIGVILTSHSELHDIKSPKTIAADVYDSIDHAVDLAIQMLIGKELYSKVFVGIDPGENPGVAVIGDGVVLHKTNVDSPEKVISKVKRFLKEYPANESIIRIGHGSVITRNRIINSLIPLEVPIEIVDETKTTSSRQVSRSEKDGVAAASIAILSGGKIQRRLPLNPTKGDIRKVQGESRKLTDGQFTISEKTALKVLKGEMSLTDAVKSEINK